MPIAKVHPDDDRRDLMPSAGSSPFSATPAPAIRVGKCQGCGKPIVWAERPDGEGGMQRNARGNYKRVPLDPSATCFIVTTDNAGNAAATTLNEFLSRVESLITKSGNVVPANRIRGVMVSHLTCKVANRFTTKARRARS